MRVLCPACAAAYEVPESVVAAGRVLRCARCAQDWTPEPLLPTAAPATMPAGGALVPPEAAEASPLLTGDAPALRPVPTLMVDRPGSLGLSRIAQPGEGRPSRVGTTPLMAAWAASAAVLVAAGWGAWHWRVSITRAWPPSERVYALFDGNEPTTGTR